MKFDRNTVLGFVILALLFFGYFYYTNKEQSEYRKKRAEELKKEQAISDSIARINKPKQDSLNKVQDSVLKVTSPDIFLAVADTTEETTVISNRLMRVTFTNKGGQIRKVELKNYKGTDSLPVQLASSDFDGISYTVNSGAGGVQRTAQTGNLFFKPGKTILNADSSQTISFNLASADSNSTGETITHEYTIRPDDYMIDFNIRMNGSDRLLTQGILNLTWKYAATQQESDISYEKQNTQIGYVKDGDFDYHTISRRSSKNFNDKVSWIGIRQRFFYGILQAPNEFSSGAMEWTIPPDTAHTVVRSTANMKLTVPSGSPSVVPFRIYYGPSDFQVVRKYGMKFDKLINLGQGPYAFVRPINKYLILPIFDFFNGLVRNPAMAIVLLTLLIRLLISPLTYTSYLSGAKMKALRPEIAALKTKFGEDRQAMSMEQMKLFREAGVNPLGGCIPALLQIPIFFALFSFFNSEPGLRGAEFLWSQDLSAFDDPIKFGFHIPLLGSHLSLFNILACATSFLISWYSMSMTPDQSNPVMKYMPYIFPVFMLFFFNRMPAGLTWYYTVSNLVTLAMQFVIQNYIIDHDKILAKIEANRKKPKTKSKWQERMEQMQEQQKKLKEMQQRNRR
ncbi:MAG: membrane protein insertase YidC [Chitinophagaceae bacterium]